MSRKDVGLFILGLVIVFVGGCGQGEIEKLKSENASLKNEIKCLKETADYHYKEGVLLLKDKSYYNAKTEFEAVIEKYPTSSLVASSRERLTEINRELVRVEAERIAGEKRRQEEEKYKPKEDRDAKDEWVNFRSAEEKYKGTVTTWRFKVSYISRENPLGRLASSYRDNNSYSVSVLGPEGYTYQCAVMLKKVPEVKEDDWMVVTGKFEYVSSDNVVVLSPIKVINEGFKK
ncbi:MAG: hypothetical protein A2536_06370 [Candidatus Firestonebacteria bacterium RIFOXYD2_FULL_39_29]|nr:MAG: hypothetical protein A2536_06370 [Candidatus Firestonebacteria bacterium RIFOXYD2_FULL_39_29]